MNSFDADTVEFTLLNSIAEGFFAQKQEALVPEFGAATHAGLVRNENQDHYAVIERKRSQAVLKTNMPADELPDLVERSHLFVVADGMGGAAFGQLASRLAIRTVWELAGRATSWLMKLPEIDHIEIRKRLDAYAQGVQKVFQRMELDNPQYHHMGTTWTSAYIVDRTVLIAHLGDSRAYLWNGKALVRLTRDQTVAQDYIDSGVPEECVQQFRHILTRCFGAYDDVSFDFRHAGLQAGDALLLCTDGLTDLVSDAEIQEAVENGLSPQNVCDGLIQLGLERGGHDNLTLVMARFH